MGLLKFLKRDPSAGAARPAAAQPAFGDESVERIRTRARHRLIGAVVLLGIAVVGFPLLFETQPRPIPVDLPIHIPKKDALPPLALPEQGRPATQAAPAEAPIITESPEEAGRDVPAAAAPPPAAVRREARAEPQAQPAPKPEPKPEPRVEARAEAKPEVKVEPKPAPKPEARPVAREEPRTEPRRTAESDAGRAQALLEGRAPAARSEPTRVAAEAGRFVLQVGAYSEGGSARDARQKVERVGLRSYTQEVETADGRRIRVRVGPFGSREEAEQAAARLRAAGLPVALLPH